MKQLMIDMMAAMMPYMKPIATAGLAMVVLGLLATVANMVRGRGGNIAMLAGKVALGVGLFFIACELAGRFLGMEPTLLFASDAFDRALYRNQWPFWIIGLALSLPGYLTLRFSARTIK